MVQQMDQLTASKPKPKVQSRRTAAGEQSDDDEEGRTSVAKVKSMQSRPMKGNLKAESSEDAKASSKSSAKKRPGSYLDELLAHRQTKKSKNQKNVNRDKAGHD
ncbi:hypothetical protein R6Q59_009911 [Mikania micrantha]